MTDSLIRSHGTPEFRRTNLALFSAGFATFALLYCVQPLMPVFARDFHVSAAQSSLSLSLTTGLLAPAMIVAGALSETRGRKRLMVASLFAASVLTVVASFATNWEAFLALRAMAGIAFAGVPAFSMAYLERRSRIPSRSASRWDSRSAAMDSAAWSAGSLSSALTDAFSWRDAIGAIGVLGLVATAIFSRTLPPSRHFVSRPVRIPALLTIFGSTCAIRRLIPLYAVGFLVMGSFVTTYNYVTYYLLDPPYSLSHAKVGLIFIVYLFGISASAWIGALADRTGRQRMLMAMLFVMLGGVGAHADAAAAARDPGIAVVTFGFFAAHSVASAWSGRRAHRPRRRRLRCICSSITWAVAWPVPRAGCSGRRAAGGPSWAISRRCF